MTSAPLGFMCGCLWFGIFLIGHIAIFRWRPKIKRSRVLVRGIATTIAASMITVALLPVPEGPAMLLRETYAVTVISCLFVLYVPFFYSVHTSLSIESLVLLMVKGGRAPLGELTARFASRRLLDARLRTMVESGYLAQKGEQFVPTPRARQLAMAFAVAKSLWRLGAGG
jgi:hypothetical protein